MAEKIQYAGAMYHLWQAANHCICAHYADNPDSRKWHTERVMEQFRKAAVDLGVTVSIEPMPEVELPPSKTRVGDAAS